MSGDADPTGEPEARSEFLDAMQQAADILTGKLAPARVHHVYKAPPGPLPLRVLQDRKNGWENTP